MPRRYAIQVPVLDGQEPPARLIENIDRVVAAQTCGRELVDDDPPHPAPRHSPLRLADDTRVSRECDRITARHFVPAVWGTQP